MQIEFLGTGTSQGIPVIACSCKVCQSTDSRDQRLRVAILCKVQDFSFVIDIGPDFRYQMLRAKQNRLDAVLITHQHRDHVGGLDDIRPFNFRYKMDMPVYATTVVQEALKKSYDYIFAADYPGVPRVVFKKLEKDRPFRLGNFDCQPIEYFHGKMPVMGFRIADFAYLTDFKTIEKEQLQYLEGLDCLVISALHHQSHYSHMNLNEALEMIDIIKPKRAYLTHLSHHMGLTKEVEKMLPTNVNIAYDGLILNLKDPQIFEQV